MGPEFRQSTVWMDCICSGMSEVSAGRPSEWELESSEVSFAHMSVGSCCHELGALVPLPMCFSGVVALWATLDFLTAWGGVGLASTGDHSKKAAEPGPERQKEERENGPLL